MANDFFNGAPQPHLPNNTGVSVTTSSALVLAQNNDRKGLILTNAGDYPIYLALGVTASAASGKGIFLSANGGMFTFDANFLWQGAIQGIAVGGASILTISEV